MKTLFVIFKGQIHYLGQLRSISLQNNFELARKYNGPFGHTGARMFQT